MNLPAVTAIYVYEMKRFFRTLMESFLSPVIGVIFGWAILDEHINATIFGALALVAVGLVLINRRKR